MDYQRSVLPTALRWGSVSLCAVTAGLLSWAVVPVNDVSVQTAQRPTVIPLPANPDQQQWKPADLDELWSRSLQGRRVAAKPVVVVEKPKVKPLPKVQAKAPVPTPLGVRLVGTIIESDSSLAIASDREGQLSFRSEGQRFQLQPKGLMIESIDDAGVWVRYKGQRIQWAVGEDLSWSNTEAGARAKRTQSDAVATSTPELRDESKSRIIQPNSDMPAAEIYDDEDEHLNDRTPIRPEEFPEMSLEDELDFLNG